jgi:DNA-binding IclR family transcriptional regulator
MTPRDLALDERSAPTGTVRAVERAMHLLLAFAGKPHQPLADLARAADLDKGTARRLLLTLMGTGFVVQDPETHLYGLGDAVRVLSSSIVENFSLRAIARPILTALAAEMQVTSFLSIYRNRSAVCLDRYHDMRGIELHWWPVGGTMPLNCGAAPKLLLSFQPAGEIEQALGEPLTALTPKSIIDPDQLRLRLKQIHDRKWEWAVDDVSLGLTAAAVPVLNASGEILCSISITGLTAQLAPRSRTQHLDRLRHAADQIRRAIPDHAMPSALIGRD